MRFISMLVKVTCLPLGGMPWNGPVWVPRKVTRAATLSPSAMMSSTESRRSGNPATKEPVAWIHPAESSGGAPGKWAT